MHIPITPTAARTGPLVIPELLLEDVDDVLTFAVESGSALLAPAPGVLEVRASRTPPRHVTAALTHLAPLLADGLRATHGATPTLSVVSLWWDVRMYRASRAGRVAIAAATDRRRACGIGPLRARHLLSLGDAVFGATASPAWHR